MSSPAAIRRATLDVATLRSLSDRSDTAGLLRTGLHAAAIAAGAALVWLALGSWWLIPAMALHGLTLVSLFAPLHESVHYTAFKSRRIADVVGFVAGAGIGWNAPYYKHFHLAHHRWCQDPERDPELSVPVPTGWGSFLVRLSGWTHWRGRLRDAWALARGDYRERPWVPEGARAEVTASMRLQLALYAALALGSVLLESTALLWLWVIPVFLAQPALRAWLVCEHTLCTDDANPLTNTRTTLVPAAMRLLMWNMPFHAEHHMYPQIPFHRLPEAHALIGPKLAHVDRGYAGTLRRIVKSFA